MAWVLLDDNFPLHPKAVDAGPVASYLYICGLCYCRKHHTGGFIPQKALSLLGLTVRPQRMVEALVKVGLWDPTDGGWLVHDYDGFYADEEDKAAKREAISEKRRTAGRRGGVTRDPKMNQTPDFGSPQDGVVRSGSSDHLLEEKKREADFSAFWNKYPRKDGKQAAREIWHRLQPPDDVQRIIAADLDRRCRSTEWLKDGGQYVPHAKTYLRQKRWEDGFVERPRLTERTVNVLKGFEEPDDLSRVQGDHCPVSGPIGSGVRSADVEAVSPRIIEHPAAAPQRRS